MNNSTIHIACNIDINYVKYCGVMLTSLFENNINAEFNIHIITDDLPLDKIQTLNNIAGAYNNRISFYFKNKDLMQGLPEDGNTYISSAAYYRCFLSEILPATIKKVLYLDCDIIVNGSIKELWNTDISNYPLAAVEDMWSNVDANYERLSYDKKFHYFNSGVLLMNLDYLRKYDLVKHVYEYAKANYEKLYYGDQDILNGLFHETKLFMPFKWNAQDGFFRRRRKIRAEVWKEVDDAIKNPVIIHYTGSKKPWQYASKHPLKQEYYKYLNMSPWKGEHPSIKYDKWLEFKVNSFLVLLGLLKPKYRKV